VLVVPGVAHGVCAKPLPKLAGTPVRSFTSPANVISKSCSYTAVMVTSKGTMRIAFDAKAAPIAVNSFVFLATKRFFDGLTFHRVLKDFVIQGGDPQGNGFGGPGYSFRDELPRTPYRLGDLVMANSGPDTNGSQFFVVTGPKGAALPFQYSRFGRLTSGLDVAKKIERLQTPGDSSGTPTRKVTIKSVRVSAK
jgi:peptidylprolyl isomerase/peptidyl-prolyl cis-trans isomerase B (cyclophilin B)